ncbi:MAG: hypothetical protein WC983_03455 [Tissierellaceae bacterium]
MFLFMSDDEDILNILEEGNLIINKYSGDMDFKSFIYDKNLDHYSHVIVDLESLNNTEEEMLEAIKAFLIIYKSKLILFSREIDDDFLSRIIELDFFDIVIPLEYEQVTQSIEESLVECIFENKLYKDRLKQFIISLKSGYKFQKNLKIFLGGVGSKLNTTKTALDLGFFLSQLGARVSYTELSDQGHLKKILNLYPFDSVYKHISFFYKGDMPMGDQGFNFNIIDIGILDENGLKVLNSKLAGVRIIGVNTDLELEKLVILSYPEDTHIIFGSSLNMDIEKERVKKVYRTENIYFAKQVDLSSLKGEATANAHIYREILKDYIIENIN